MYSEKFIFKWSDVLITDMAWMDFTDYLPAPNKTLLIDKPMHNEDVHSPC